MSQAPTPETVAAEAQALAADVQKLAAQAPKIQRPITVPPISKRYGGTGK